MAREMSKQTEKTAVPVQKTEQDPFREMIGFRDTINGMFEDFFSGRPLLASAFPESPVMAERGFSIPVDIVDSGEELVVYAAMLGIPKNDCKIEVKDNVLMLSGECKEEGEKGEYLRRELPTGQFYRAFTLPTNVKAGEVKAKYVDGILEIHLPKADNAKPRPISIE